MNALNLLVVDDDLLYGRLLKANLDRPGRLRAEVVESAERRWGTWRYIRCRPSSPTCQVDVLVLRQVIAILVDNAVRHAVPGPVKLSAELVPPNLVVRVRDSGSGPFRPPGPGRYLHNWHGAWARAVPHADYTRGGHT